MKSRGQTGRERRRWRDRGRSTLNGHPIIRESGNSKVLDFCDSMGRLWQGEKEGVAFLSDEDCLANNFSNCGFREELVFLLMREEIGAHKLNEGS